MELNGFEIDKFNQYGLNEKDKHSACPLCSADRKKKTDKCATLHWDTGLGVCHHCGETFQLHTYKSKKKENVKTYKRPIWQNNTKLSEKLVKWFENRGISQFTLRQMQICEGSEWMPQTKKPENTVQFPYFRNSELINIKYRDGAKNFKMVSDAEKICYNFDACRIAKELIIAEGEVDVLSWWEVGKTNSTSVPNGSQLKGNVNLDWLDNSIEVFENKERYYLAIDNDPAGDKTRAELIRRLGAEKCFLVDFTVYKLKVPKEDGRDYCKDSNEVLMDYGRDALLQCLADAKIVPLVGASGVLDWEAEFDDYLVNGYNSGYKTGIKSLDENFSTYTGQTIVVTGIPSSGKSDFVDQMCIGYNRLYGWKIGVASPENKPNPIHAAKLAGKICGQWINRKGLIETDWFQACKLYLHDNFKYIDLDVFDLESVLNKAKELIFRFGIKCLILDPYNKTKLKSSAQKNINDYTGDYMLTLDEFARKYDILIILVIHPRKPGVGESLTYKPTAYDIKGGGEIYDMTPHILRVHRDYGLDMVEITILKVKFSHLGKNNKSIWLKWNDTNGRFMDFETQAEDASQVSGMITDNSNWLVVDDVPVETDLQQAERNFYEPTHKQEGGSDEVPF